MEGVANVPRNVNGHFLYTVNNLQVPLQIPEIDILPGYHLLPLLPYIIGDLIFLSKQGHGIMAAFLQHQLWL
jgi:hypothetical protein